MNSDWLFSYLIHFASIEEDAVNTRAKEIMVASAEVYTLEMVYRRCRGNYKRECV
jgi:hypothetical protein